MNVSINKDVDYGEVESSYNRHYIRVDAVGNITAYWSDGPIPTVSIPEDAVLYNDKGGYQFRLFHDGEENPRIMNERGIFLYRYIDGAAVAKTDAEIQSEIERLSA